MSPPPPRPARAVRQGFLPLESMSRPDGQAAGASPNEDRPQPDDRLRVAEAILAEAIGRAAAVDIAHLCREHPDLASELRRLHAAWEWLEHSSGADRTPRPSGAPAATPAQGTALDPDAHRAGGRYQFLDSVARGGMGTVVRVWDQRLRRPLAMKLAGTQPDGSTPCCSPSSTVRRFLHEAYVMSRLDHPGVLPVHDLGRDEHNRMFLTMRVVDGYDFGTVLGMVSTASSGWTLPRAVEVLIKVCETVAYAHSKGFIHRDLKPRNVMIGQFDQVYVVDWGLARAVDRPFEVQAGTWPVALGANDSTLVLDGEAMTYGEFAAAPGHEPASCTQEGTALGTPAYMPPEQARGDQREIGTRADVYAIGAILYHLLAQRPPFSDLVDDDVHVLDAVRTRAPTPIHRLTPRAPPELVAVSNKAMSREIGARYGELGALAGDLRAWLENRPVSALRCGPLAPARRWVRRNPFLTIALATLTLVASVALGAAGWLMTRGRQAEAELHDQVAAARGDAREQSARADALDVRAGDAAYAARLAAAQAAIERGRIAIARPVLDGCPIERRGFEWRHLRSQIDSSWRTLGDLEHRVPRFAALAPDGSRAYCTTGHGPVLVVDSTTGAVQRSLEGLTARGTCIAVAGDGTWLAAGDSSGRIQTWNADSGAPLRNWAAHGPGTVWDLEIDAARTQLASVSEDGAARVWSVATGELVHELRPPGGAVYSASFDPSRPRLLTTSQDGTLRIWDLATEKVVASRTVRAFFSNQYWRARFLGEGRSIACGTARGSIEVFDAATLAPLATLEGHAASAREIVPCGADLLATSASDGTLRVWSSADWRCVRQISAHEHDVCSLEFTGRWLISGSYDGTVRLWDLAAPQQPDVQVLAFPAQTIALLANRLFLAGSGRMQLQVLGAPDAIWSRVGPERVRHACWSPDGARIALASEDGRVRVLDGETGDVLVTCPSHGDGGHVSFHPDGKRVVTGGLDGAVRICSALDGQAEATLANGAGVYAVEFTPAGDAVVIGDANGRLRVWDPARKEIVRDVSAHSTWLYRLAFSHDGRHLVSSSWDGTAAIWDAKTWSRTAVLRGHSEFVFSAAFSHDGTRVVTTGSDATVRVWDARSGTQLLCLLGHGSWVLEGVFAPDDSWLATVSHDSTLRFWRAP